MCNIGEFDISRKFTLMALAIFIFEFRKFRISFDSFIYYLIEYVLELFN